MRCDAVSLTERKHTHEIIHWKWNERNDITAKNINKDFSECQLRELILLFVFSSLSYYSVCYALWCVYELNDVWALSNEHVIEDRTFTLLLPNIFRVK